MKINECIINQYLSEHESEYRHILIDTLIVKHYKKMIFNLEQSSFIK